MMHGESWSAEDLGSALKNGAGLLLLDCRDPNQYQTSHVKGALHVTIPAIILRRMKKTGRMSGSLASVISCPEDKQCFTTRLQSDMVLVYEQCSYNNEPSDPTISSLLISKLLEDGCRVCLLKGGFESFESQYPEWCTASEEIPLGTTPTSILGLSNLTIKDSRSDPSVILEPKDDDPNQATTSVFPVEVLPHLFLGNCENSEDLECLYRHNIKHIVNVTQDVASHFEHDGNIKYLRIPIKDHWSENLSDFFYQAIVFIEDARQKQEGVLIHCLAGISRSVTITLAYLMHSLNLDLNEAFECVKRKRANISPNFNFMGQLQDFEKSLKSQRNCTCNCPKRNSFFAGAPTAAETSEADLAPRESRDSAAVRSKEAAARGGLVCACSCHSLKSYFTSPGSTYNSSGSSTVSSSGNASSPQFSYDVPPSPS